jgi:hypothetical protein
MGGETMRFMIISDSKGKQNGINEKILTKLLEESRKLVPEPEFIMLGGDNVAGSSEKDILASQLQGLRILINKYYPNKTLLPVIGNHEVNIEPSDDILEKVFAYNYRDTLPHTCLQGYNNTVYYSDYLDTRIIVLNSFHCGELHKIGERQLVWLEKIASVHMKNKLVFVHSPAFPTGAHFGHCLDLYPDYRDAFWDIVEKCNINIVFSGHEHNYSIREIKSQRTVYQIITGGGGEKLKDKYIDKKGILRVPIAKYHFVIVDVEEKHIKVSAISSEGRILHQLKI